MSGPELFRQARIAAGLTLSDVAKRANLDPSTICLYERQKARPSPSARERWERSLIELLTERSERVVELLQELLANGTWNFSTSDSDSPKPACPSRGLEE